jgi:hypothetical protein
MDLFKESWETRLALSQDLVGVAGERPRSAVLLFPTSISIYRRRFLAIDCFIMHKKIAARVTNVISMARMISFSDAIGTSTQE